jgi:hypothetical protein
MFISFATMKLNPWATTLWVSGMVCVLVALSLIIWNIRKSTTTDKSNDAAARADQATALWGSLVGFIGVISIAVGHGIGFKPE